MPFPNPDTQFQPGQSGNPNGYSRGRRVTDELAKLIEETAGDKSLAKVSFREALKGNPFFFKLLLDRIEDPIGLLERLGSADRPIEIETAEPPRRIIIPDVDDRLARED